MKGHQLHELNDVPNLTSHSFAASSMIP